MTKRISGIPLVAILFCGIYSFSAKGDQPMGGERWSPGGKPTVNLPCKVGKISIGVSNESCLVVLSDGSHWQCDDCEVEYRQDENCKVYKVVIAANGCTTSDYQTYQDKSPLLVDPKLDLRLRRQLNRGVQKVTPRKDLPKP
jgi:hypothetical protein